MCLPAVVRIPIWGRLPWCHQGLPEGFPAWHLPYEFGSGVSETAPLATKIGLQNPIFANICEHIEICMGRNCCTWPEALEHVYIKCPYKYLHVFQASHLHTGCSHIRAKRSASAHMHIPLSHPLALFVLHCLFLPPPRPFTT